MAFFSDRLAIEKSYSDLRASSFEADTGFSREELEKLAFEKNTALRASGLDPQLVRARLFAYLLDNARVGANPAQLFADGFDCEGILTQVLWADHERCKDDELRRLEAQTESAQKAYIFSANADYGHLCPDWEALMRLGLPGILRRLREAKAAHGTLSPSQCAFYDAGILVYEAICRNIPRLAARCSDRTRALLEPLALRAPETFGEGLQLMLLMFRLMEYVDGMRIRSLGGFDRLLIGLWRSDLARGIPEATLTELLRYFLFQLWAMHVPYDLPLYIAGQYADGTDASNELTRVFIETYSALDIYSPKIHVRVSEDTPEDVLHAVCRSIRKGNSSFVFISDETAIRALLRAGLSPEDARNYVPIGCYEPGGFGTEIPCTGNGKILLPRVLELALHDGMDPVTGIQEGPHTGNPVDFPDFETFYGAFRRQMAYFTGLQMELVRRYEAHYGEVYPIPLLSATYASCLENGKDALSGGAKYNNSSSYMGCIGSVTDSLVVIRRCYEGLMPMEKLLTMLDANWKGYEKERLMLDKLPRYGNNQPEADTLAIRVCEDFSAYTLGKPNGRGGVFKPANFTIDWFVPAGAHCGATPDGRYAGTPLSKNLGTLSGKDRSGVTALIQSASRLCCDRFPTGSVLDIMLHPSSVSGEEGCFIMAGLVRTYFRLGGYAIHGNVTDAATLRAAQADPEAYSTLQVRLCGWNVYFVNLTKAEQDELILAAEGA